MEGREKKARVDSLNQLRRLRTEGGSRLEALGSGGGEVDDDDGFVEGAHEGDDDQFVEQVVDTGRTFKSRPSAFSIRPTTGHGRVGARTTSGSGVGHGSGKVDATAILQGDNYFQSLMAQMEASASEDDDTLRNETRHTDDHGLKQNAHCRPPTEWADGTPAPISVIGATARTGGLGHRTSMASMQFASVTSPVPAVNTFDVIPDFLATAGHDAALLKDPSPATDPAPTSEIPMEEEEEGRDAAAAAAAEWFDDTTDIDMALQTIGSGAAATGAEFMMQVDSTTTTSATPMEGGEQERERGRENKYECSEKGGEETNRPPAGTMASGDSDTGDMVNFYWLDAYEKPNSGVLYLFGKTASDGGAAGTGRSYVSTCVIINGMRRNVFFLPRETIPDGGGGEREVTLKDVHEEISQMAANQRITLFGCKRVQRRYAFEIPDIPVEADYVKLVYPFSSPALVTTGTGHTFSHVFGVHTGALELFLVKRRIMGPCWLQLPCKAINRVDSGATVSWCRREMSLDDPKAVRVLITDAPPAPPLTVLSLALRTIVEPHSRTHEVVAVSGLAYASVSIEGGSGGPESAKREAAAAALAVKCTEAFSVARETEDLGGFTAKFIADTMTAYRHATSPSPTLMPGSSLELAKNERAVLTYLVARIYRLDPDVIVGHNFLGFDLGVLLHRMRANKVDYWSRLGRLSWSQWPRGRPGSTEASYAERLVLSGRLVCDTYLAARDLVRSRNYSLGTLVESQLGAERTDMDWERVREYFETPDRLAYLLRHCEGDAHWIMRLMTQLMVLPLTKQLTNIAGNLWARTLVGGRAERNEYLLLHEFHRLKYIVPDKGVPAKLGGGNSGGQGGVGVEGEEDVAMADYAIATGGDGKDEHPEGGVHAQGKNSTGGRRKAAYAGGLVLEPKKGLYRNIVLLLDFNSLYPSIIQEFNICFTTVERNAADSSEALPPLPEASCPPGVLPRLLAALVARRREIKRLMKDPRLSPAEAAQLHIRQQALKLTANSMYGCLGFAQSRFHARPLASLITGKGREILASTVELARGTCQLEVVYGDTDSVMVHTGTRDLPTAKRMAQELKRVVNERYRLLEIELDGIFGALLLLKKKKYAALILEEHADGTISQRIESKGLDLVRRDWCALSVDTSTVVLEKILLVEDGKGGGEEDSLREQPTMQRVADQIHIFLRTVADEISQGLIPLEKYTISKVRGGGPARPSPFINYPHLARRILPRNRSSMLMPRTSPT